MFGWRGDILEIDLSSAQWRISPQNPEVLTKFIGGRGLAGYYLHDAVTLNWDDPAMPLLLFTGPLVDTPSPTSGRMTFMSRSPLTGTIGDSSVGGSFGVRLKRAGFDGVIIRGKSAGLCGIHINDHHVSIIDVRHLASAATSRIFSLFDDHCSVAAIGPAAENKVRFSNIMVDRHHAAGRNGLGLVMADKGIKYITVTGTGRTPVHNAQALKNANEDVLRLISASPVLSGEFGISKYGTGALYDLMDARSIMPTHNFRRAKFSSARAMNAFAYTSGYGSSRTGCRGCHIRCKRLDSQGGSLPEFETMSHFSALLDNTDIEAVVQANQICNETGMDTISAAVTLACYAEIQGITLSGGEIQTLLWEMAYCRGLGQELGQGALRYAVAQGAPQAAMTVKGQELSAYHPCGAYSMALAFAVSSRGACHLRAYPISHEILRKPVATDRFSFAGKARIVKISEDLNAAADSLTACKFMFLAASLEEYAAVYTAVTGTKTTAQDLLKIGERINYHERLMNAANGFSLRDDTLPERFFHPEPEDEIQPINRQDFERALVNYFKVRKLSPQGMPLPEIANELGLNLITKDKNHA